MKLAVIGQGYVGLPLAVAAAGAGHVVVGIDTNSPRVRMLNSGISPVEDIDGDVIRGLIDSGIYSASTDFDECAIADVIAVCANTVDCR